MPGMGELMVILLIVLLIFGAGKLPEIGDSLGRSIKNFKRSSSGGNEIDVSKRPAVEGADKRELADAARETERETDDRGIVEAEVVAKRKAQAEES